MATIGSMLFYCPILLPINNRTIAQTFLNETKQKMKFTKYKNKRIYMKKEKSETHTHTQNLRLN